MLGPDLFNGTAAQLTQFKNSTGATFPLLLNGAVGTGNANFFTVYGDRDNYAVISKQGTVRYNAFDHWPYGSRYHLDELRGCIDSLLTVTTGVEEGGHPGSFALSATPNPSRGVVTLALANPTAGDVDARVEVYDLAGRAIASLWNGALPPGVTRLEWSGLDVDGLPAAAGVYLVRARLSGTVLSRRVLRVR